MWFPDQVNIALQFECSDILINFRYSSYRCVEVYPFCRGDPFCSEFWWAQWGTKLPLLGVETPSQGRSWKHKQWQRSDDSPVAMSTVFLLTWVPNSTTTIATSCDTSPKINLVSSATKCILIMVPLPGACLANVLRHWVLQAFWLQGCRRRMGYVNTSFFSILHHALRQGLKGELQKEVQCGELQLWSLVCLCKGGREGLWLTFIGCSSTKG